MCSFWTFRINETIQRAVLCVCLASFTEHHVSRFIRVGADAQVNISKYPQAREILFSFRYLHSQLWRTVSARRKTLLPSQSFHLVIPFMIFAAGSATGPRVQSEMIMALPTAPLSGLFPCVMECLVGVLSVLPPLLDLMSPSCGPALPSDHAFRQEGRI